MRLTILLAVLSLAATAFAAEWVDRAAVNNASAGVFRLQAIFASGAVASGSAVQIAPGKFVTSCHVTRDAKGINIQRGIKSWAAYWQFKDIEHDLCVIALREGPQENTQIGRSGDLRIGQRVFAVGYPGGQGGLAIREGQVKALYDYAGGKIIRSDAFFSLGESGGALFDADGKLVGILTFKAAVGVGYYFAVPVEWVAEVEQKAAKNPSPRNAVAFWEPEFKAPPLFLDVVPFEATSEWAQLESAAKKWGEREAASAEPWVALGKALYHLNRKSEAVSPLKKAVELSPQHTEGWFQLGLVYRDLNDNAGLEQVRERLNSLQPARATELNCAAAC